MIHSFLIYQGINSYNIIIIFKFQFSLIKNKKKLKPKKTHPTPLCLNVPTMKINYICLLTWFLLSAFSVTNAIPKSDIQNLCRETTDAAFCMNQLDSDPRIEAARDLGDVLVIAVMFYIFICLHIN